MMKLTKLLERLEYKVVQGNDDIEITELTNDSRRVCAGSVFVCISGAVVDGHEFVKEVSEKGAKAVIVEKEVEAPEHVTVIKVEDTRYALALASAAYFGYPAEQLKVIGITGTKGKTTTTYMVKSILEGVGHKVGLIGTIEAIIGDEVIPAKNTTPESFTIHQYFRKMVDAGCDAVVMEVSSQGLMLHRTAGIPFEIGIFTNLGEDHIGPNEHKDFEDYKRCKGLLFKQCRIGIANVDAHNAMSLESLLTTLKEYHPKRLVCLFGCGGNRAKARRYEMGEVSGKLADLTIITSDNPRFEEPQDIIDDIKIGIGKTDGKYVEICDRKEAIRYAVDHAEVGDVIVLAGKGHEDYQEIKGVKYDMDERILIAEVVKESKRENLIR